MKKKGLIISTVVMVVVLIASLTTATYAWFTQSSVTTIEGFNLTVEASTAVSIGLKKNCTYTAAADGLSQDLFVNGECTFSGAAGTLAGSSWGGTAGLGPAIQHNIKYDKVLGAVGVTTEPDLTALTEINTSKFPTTLAADAKIVRAVKGEDGKLSDVALAVANGYTVGSGEGAQTLMADYAYLFLGVTPAKALKEGSNNVYIVVQANGNGSTLGLAAAMHVAYRLNGEAEWHDVDVFDAAGLHQADSRTNQNAIVEVPMDLTNNLNGLEGTAAGDPIKTTFPRAQMVTIPLEQYAMGATNIDQLELVIYMAGSDGDCVDAAKGVTINVGIFFGAQAVA